MKLLPVLDLAMLLAVTACAVAAESPQPARAVLPPHPWGVYEWTRHSKDPLPADLPLKGFPLILRWANLEPQPGQYAFDSEVRAPLETARQLGQYIHLKLWVAPDEITPEWLFAQGVPRVETKGRTNPFRKQVKPLFPYYFSPVYQTNFHHIIQALGDYLASLPKDLKGRIVFVQSAEGSTGDGGPYKGELLDPRYEISKAHWNAFRRETWAVYLKALQRVDGSLRLPLLVNGDANGAEENAWLLDHCDLFGLKQGMFSHGYLVSESQTRLTNWEMFRAGEQDGEWKVCGWSRQNPPQAFYWSALFALHNKLDLWNVPSDALATQPIGEAVRLFDRYAGYNEPSGSPVAFCALRRGLDAADTNRFPESEFGPAKKNNRARYLAIAQAFAGLGARQGDPDKAMGGGMINRQADDQNDVGWDVLPGNFERFLTQLDPEGTSLGLWHVGPDQHPYSLFARRLDAASGRKVMRFQIADGFFDPPAEAHAVRVRVVYLDKEQGAWELVYANSQGEKVARRVELKNSGQWLDLVVTLPDAVWNHRLADGADLALRHAAGDDTTFHLIELERQ